VEESEGGVGVGKEVVFMLGGVGVGKVDGVGTSVGRVRLVVESLLEEGGEVVTGVGNEVGTGVEGEEVEFDGRFGLEFSFESLPDSLSDPLLDWLPDSLPDSLLDALSDWL
jgi:hypothetical protein